jgi:glycosyltransferase involved in cell wall biosynthesis
MVKLLIGWNGLPIYGARAIGKLVSRGKYHIRVVATRSSVCPRLIEAAAGVRIDWVDGREALRDAAVSYGGEGLYFCPGWSTPAFLNLAKCVLAAGGKAVLMLDNSKKGTLRQALGHVLFRLRYSRLFEGFLVPGLSTTELLASFGVAPTRIFTGLYGGDPVVFSPGPQISSRPIHFVFVGQFIARKGISAFAEACRQLLRDRRDLRIRAIGNGPLAEMLQGTGIEIQPFAPADRVAECLRASRFLVLPSMEEHWGVVVHEAALSGCGLILSDRVGSRFDLLTPANGFMCVPGDSHALLQAMRCALGASPIWLRQCREKSLSLAAKFGPNVFADSIDTLVGMLGQSCRTAADVRET